MSIAEKLTKMAENTNKVYTAGLDMGYRAGYDMGYQAGNDAGKSSAWCDYDAFWDGIQYNGTRTQYHYAFYLWTDEMFQPKYSIRPNSSSGATGMFRQARITDLDKLLNDRNVVLDFSKVTKMSETFASSQVTKIPTIDMTACRELIATFKDASELGEIKFYFPGIDRAAERTTKFDRTFVGCASLRDVYFIDSNNGNWTGLINNVPNDANGLYFGDSPNLTCSAVMNIVGALGTPTNGSGTKVVFHKTAFDRAYAEAGENLPILEYIVGEMRGRGWDIISKDPYNAAFITNAHYVATGLRDNTAIRCMLVSTGESTAKLSVDSGNFEQNYYAIPIPEGVSKVAFFFEGCKFNISEVANDGTIQAVNEVWHNSGDTYAFTGNYKYFVAKFMDNDNAAFGPHFNATFTMDCSGDSLIINFTKVADDIVLPQEVAFTDDVAFLAECNHDGTGLNYYDRAIRALAVSSADTGVTYKRITGSSAVTHYAMRSSRDATKITVNCGADLMFNVVPIGVDGSKLSANSVWYNSGAEYTFPVTYFGYYLIAFKKTDDSSLKGYNPSQISWTIE